MAFAMLRGAITVTSFGAGWASKLDHERTPPKARVIDP
jgi:hypothetical protein